MSEPQIILPGTDPGDPNNEDKRKTIELNYGKFKLKVRGYDLLVILCVVSVTLGAWLLHAHTEDTKELKTSLAEVIYILSLSQTDREKLSIDMPNSLRGKVIRHDKYDRP